MRPRKVLGQGPQPSVKLPHKDAPGEQAEALGLDPSSRTAQLSGEQASNGQTNLKGRTLVLLECGWPGGHSPGLGPDSPGVTRMSFQEENSGSPTLLEARPSIGERGFSTAHPWVCIPALPCPAL